MGKKLLLIALPFIAFHLIAMEPSKDEQEWHKPKFKNEIFDALIQHVERQDLSIVETTIQDAARGATIPVVWVFNLCSKVISAIYSQGHEKEPIRLNPLVSMVIAGIPAIIAGIPGGIIGSSYGLCYSLTQKIRARRYNNEFDFLITLHLYQWIDLIKKSRLFIQDQIEKWQQENNNQSIKLALKNILIDEKFIPYFKDAGWSESDFDQLLESVDNAHDNWHEFFSFLSFQIKSPKLDGFDWLNLTHALTNFSQNKKDFPEISTEDINEYIYFAVYFFTLSSDNMKLLKSYIAHNGT